MPVKWLLHPGTGERLSFEEAPARLDCDGLMPSFAVEAVVRQHKESKPSFNVRPSDVSPTMACRRQRVWETNHEYGANPLVIESMTEGSAYHTVLGTQEIEVPPRSPKNEWIGLPVCGVPMRGRIDWLLPDRIDDLKTSTPFWYPRFPTKEMKAKDPTLRAWCEIWQPKDEDEIAKWVIQQSIYRVLLIKSGLQAPIMGRVWRRYSGVKGEKGRYKRFDFTLLTEEELEAKVGPWVRGLAEALSKAESGDIGAWRTVPADGREFIGSKGNRWACDRCPARKECDMTGGWVGF